MIVHANGSYETGDWLTADTYPGSHFIDESKVAGIVLAEKIRNLYATQSGAYYTLVIENGVLVDVVPRAKTPEEIAAENASPPSPDVRISELEQTVAALTQILTEKGITP